ncbi:gp16 family protein [Chitinimonas sp.]|uniref:gp16 family protein n=1 Tax=Chitinimonas sp. TaxID=1934313 RepID=UPI0035AE22B6
MTARTAALAKIHIAKQQLAMDDASYRALLQRVALVDSASKLDRAGQDAVLAEMQRLGFKPARNSHGKRPKPPASRAGLIAKIEAQLAEAGRPWSYADGIARRMYAVDKVDWLTDPAQLQAVIAALYLDAKRHQRSTR